MHYVEYRGVLRYGAVLHGRDFAWNNHRQYIRKNSCPSDPPDMQSTPSRQPIETTITTLCHSGCGQGGYRKGVVWKDGMQRVGEWETPGKDSHQKSAPAAARGSLYFCSRGTIIFGRLVTKDYLKKRKANVY